MGNRRWEGDERGEGVADAGAFTSDAAQLLEAMCTPRWVAEEPDVHLLPHMQRACESLPLQLIDVRISADGSFDVDLRWTGETQRRGDARAAVFALVGSFAESSTFVRQADAGLVFEVVTGMLDGATQFAPHGHTVRISVVGVR